VTGSGPLSCPRGRLDPPDQPQPDRDEGGGGRPAAAHARNGARLACHGAERLPT
jgi:hypothetical protein